MEDLLRQLVALVGYNELLDEDEVVAGWREGEIGKAKLLNDGFAFSCGPCTIAVTQKRNIFYAVSSQKTLIPVRVSRAFSDQPAARKIYEQIVDLLLA